MRRQPVGALVALVCLAANADAASAQDRLVLGGRDVGAVGRFGQDLGPAPADLTSGPTFGGGRYVLYGASVVFDRRTRTRIDLPVGWQALLGDPVRPRVYAWVPPAVPGGDGALAALDLSTGSPLTVMQLPALPYPAAFNYSIRVAADADLVFAAADGGFGSPTGVVHLATATGGVATQRTIQLLHPTGANGLAGPRLQSFDVTPDGTRIFAGITDASVPSLSGVHAFEVASGVEVHAAHTSMATEVRWDSALDALIATSQHDVVLLSRDLDVVAQGAPGGCAVSLQVSAHTGRAYLLSGGGHYFSLRFPQFLQALDTRTGQWTGPVDVTRSLALAYECETNLQLYTAPGMPRGLQATASGHTVTLQWQHVGAAHTFVLAAGIGPGRTDAVVPLGPDSHVTFSGVPPGTYYLRLRGVNEFGAGRWSPEVRVVVP